MSDMNCLNSEDQLKSSLSDSQNLQSSLNLDELQSELGGESQISSILAIDSLNSDMDSYESTSSELVSENQIDSKLDLPTVVRYTGKETESTETIVDNVNNKISVNVKNFEWMNFNNDNWVKVSSYYTLTIEFSTHKFLNAYISEMLIKVDDDYECVLKPTYKLLANGDIYIRSDKPVICKILIKGDR